MRRMGRKQSFLVRDCRLYRVSIYPHVVRRLLELSTSATVVHGAEPCDVAAFGREAALITGRVDVRYSFRHAFAYLVSISASVGS